MRRLLSWLVGVAVGGGIVFVAFQFHVVRTDHRWLLVRKQQNDWRDAYVDVRGWNVQKWSEHPLLSRNLVASGHGEIVVRSTADQFFRGLFNPLGDRDPENE